MCSLQLLQDADYEPELTQELVPAAIEGEITLAPGEIRLNTEENTCLHFKHNGGIIEVTNDKVLALVSS